MFLVFHSVFWWSRFPHSSYIQKPPTIRAKMNVGCQLSTIQFQVYILAILFSYICINTFQERLSWVRTNSNFQLWSNNNARTRMLSLDGANASKQIIINLKYVSYLNTSSERIFCSSASDWSVKIKPTLSLVDHITSFNNTEQPAH